jgi:hypothetical protein
MMDFAPLARWFDSNCLHLTGRTSGQSFLFPIVPMETRQSQGTTGVGQRDVTKVRYGRPCPFACNLRLTSLVARCQ